MLYLSQEATNKDQQLKSQMLISFQDDETKGSENIWVESGFFGDQRSELTIQKANFHENTLCYINQGSVSLVKSNEKAMYLVFVVLGQIMPPANIDPAINLDTHAFKENEVLMYTPVYNKLTALYGGLTKKLGYITLRVDDKEPFYSNRYDKEKSVLLYSWMKTPLPNIFHCTAFKKHYPFLFDENQKKSKFSNMFIYLLSTLDREEDLLQYKEHIHLHPVDFTYDDLKEITVNKDKNPSLLNCKELRGEVTGAYYKIMKKIADISNQNLVRNSDAYISNGRKIDPDNEFSWIDDFYKLTKNKFQLSY